MVPWKGFDTWQLLWRFKWTLDITDRLVTEVNPQGNTTNSYLELAGGLLYLDNQAQTLNIRERTCLIKTDNIATLYWQRKGNTRTEKVSTYLLCLFGIHQKFHRYVPRHDYLTVKYNPLADELPRLFHITAYQNTNRIQSILPHTNGYHHWHPTKQIVFAILTDLRKKTSSLESLLLYPAPPPLPGTSGKNSSLIWPSIPY